MKTLITTVIALGCFGLTQVYPNFLEGWESSRKDRISRTEYKRQASTCKYYIIGVAETEKEVSGRLDTVIYAELWMHTGKFFLYR